MVDNADVSEEAAERTVEDRTAEGTSEANGTAEETAEADRASTPTREAPSQSTRSSLATLDDSPTNRTSTSQVDAEPWLKLRDVLDSRLTELKEHLLMDLGLLMEDLKSSSAAGAGNKVEHCASNFSLSSSAMLSISSHLRTRASLDSNISSTRNSKCSFAPYSSQEGRMTLSVPGKQRVGFSFSPRASPKGSLLSGGPLIARTKGDYGSYEGDHGGYGSTGSHPGGYGSSMSEKRHKFNSNESISSRLSSPRWIRSILNMTPLTSGQDSNRSSIAEEKHSSERSNGNARPSSSAVRPSQKRTTRGMVSFVFGRNMEEPDVKGGYKPNFGGAGKAHAPALLRAKTCDLKALNEVNESEADQDLQYSFPSFAPGSASISCPLNNLHSSESSDEQILFEVAANWLIKPDTRLSNVKGGKNLPPALTRNMDIYCDNEDDAEDNHQSRFLFFDTCFQKMSVQQTSIKRVLWDFLGFLMVAYDFILIPLQLFEIPEGTLQSVASNVARIYWTLDIFMSFITTQVLPDGKMVNKFRDIAKSYIHSWFLFDFTIVTFDWIDWISTVGQRSRGGDVREGSDGRAEFIRSMRLLRVVRLLRLVRIMLNAPEMTRFVVYYVRSEKVHVVMGIVKIMFFVVGLAHVLACGWYGVGKDSGVQGWVAMEELRDGTLGARYASAFYWSVAQFTGASSQIPFTTNERVYGIIVQLVAFVNSVSIVSSLTTLMTRLQLITAQSATQLSVLRRYLMDNRISSKIATRVLRNANHVISELKRNTPETDVELMSLISHPLHVELRYEVHSPTLTQHPFFFCYNKTNPAAMRQQCYQSIGKLQVSRGDVLFSAGEVMEDSSMFFVLKGALKHSRESYRRTKLDDQTVDMVLREGCWLHEAALWTTFWTFAGNVRATSECGLLCIQKQIFQQVATQFRTTEFYPAQYANVFVEELNSVNPADITEISELMIDLEQIVRGIFPDEVNNQYHSRKHSRSSKLQSLLRTSKKASKAKGPSKVHPQEGEVDIAAAGMANTQLPNEEKTGDGKQAFSNFSGLTP